MTHKLEAGSYSSGSTRTIDMAGMFMTIGVITVCDVCTNSGAKAHHMLTLAHSHEQWCEMDTPSCTVSDDARDEAQHMVEELFEHVDTHVEDGYHFGAHEGDGADFGVWPNNEHISFEVSYRFHTTEDIDNSTVQSRAQAAIEHVMLQEEGDSWSYLKVVSI